MAGHDGLEHAIIIEDDCDPRILEPWRVINEGVTRVDDRIGAQGYGHRANCRARPGSRKFSHSHGVSWTQKTKILRGSELSWFQEKCK